MTIVLGYSAYAEQSSQSLYSYVMDTYSKSYVDMSVPRMKLEALQREYNLTVHANLQAESFEFVKAYAHTVEVEINTKIDEEVNSLQESQKIVAADIEEGLDTLTPKELSILNREYFKYTEDIDSMLKDKTSMTSLFENPTYEKIDTSALELSIQEQESILSFDSSDTDTNIGVFELLKRPFDVNVNVTSRAGFRVDPIDGQIKFHNATDYGMPTGTPLYSLFNGTVTRSNNIGDGYGDSVKIDCGNGIVIHYAHMSERIVQLGDEVKQNQLIGYSGSTGRSTGPHLHLSLFYQGEVLDVERLFE